MCVLEASVSGRIFDFINVRRVHVGHLCFVVWFLISGQPFATGCNICVCLQACTIHTLAWVCEVCAEGFISEDISVPCLQPRTFFLWFNPFCFVVFFVVFFHVSCFSRFYSNAIWFVLQSSVISFLWYEVLVPGVAGLSGWTLHHWKMILWGFDLQSAPLYFARPPLAAFAFVSPLLVRPRY